jgi:Tfp pilus assembly protein PilF
VEAENPDGALALLQRAVAENPDNEEAVRQLAAEYQRRGQLRQARLFYRAAVALDPEDAGLALRLEEVERALRDSGGKPPEAAP